jgi:hypothetical protein
MRSRELQATVVRVVLGLTLSLSSSLLGQQTPRLTFRAPASQLQQENNSLAKNKSPEDLVEVTLPGRLHNPPLPIHLIQKTQADWSTPESAMASIRSANTAGDSDWILLNFVPEERQKLQKLMRDPAVFHKNTEYYSSVQKAEITGWAEYGKFKIVFLREESAAGKGRIAPVTLTRTPSGWKQTNALSGDDTLHLVWAALTSGDVH